MPLAVALRKSEGEPGNILRRKHLLGAVFRRGSSRRSLGSQGFMGDSLGTDSVSITVNYLVFVFFNLPVRRKYRQYTVRYLVRKPIFKYTGDLKEPQINAHP